MSRLRLQLAIFAALLGLAGAARASDEVLYPRGSAPAGASAETQKSGLNMTVGLLAVVCATAGAWLYWRNRRTGVPGLGRVERRLAIAETRSLGNRQYLLVADYEGKKFLLGVCPGRIDLLTPLEGEAPAKTP